MRKRGQGGLKFLVWKKIFPLLKLGKHGERWALGTNHDFAVDIVSLKYIWDDQARKSVRQLETMVKLGKRSEHRTKIWKSLL